MDVEEAEVHRGEEGGSVREDAVVREVVVGFRGVVVGLRLEGGEVVEVVGDSRGVEVRLRFWDDVRCVLMWFCKFEASWFPGMFCYVNGKVGMLLKYRGIK